MSTHTTTPIRVNGVQVEVGQRWVPRFPDPDTKPVIVTHVGSAGFTVKHDGEDKTWAVSPQYLSYYALAPVTTWRWQLKQRHDLGDDATVLTVYETIPGMPRRTWTSVSTPHGHDVVIDPNGVVVAVDNPRVVAADEAIASLLSYIGNEAPL